MRESSEDGVRIVNFHDRIRCRKETCSENQNGVCISGAEQCDRDLFKCTKCRYREWVNNPLSRASCSSCGTRHWDKDWRGTTETAQDHRVYAFDPWKSTWFLLSEIPEERRDLIERWKNDEKISKEEIEETDYEGKKGIGIE